MLISFGEGDTMVNDIKLDSTKLTTLTGTSPQKTDRTPTTCKQKHGDVTVSSHLASLLTVDPQTECEQDSRVMDIKNKIQSGRYQIDTDKLSESIYHQLFGKKA